MKVICGEIYCKNNYGALGRKNRRCKKKRIRLVSMNMAKSTDELSCRDYEYKDPCP